MADSLLLPSFMETALAPSGLRSLQKLPAEAPALDGSSRPGFCTRRSRSRFSITCATQSGGTQAGGTKPGGGTRYIGGKRVKVLQEGDKLANLRDKVVGEPASVKLLSRVEELRLLSKAEKAGLLSAAERAGFSLSTIERLGLLSKAEDLGLLSAATDRTTPGSLLTLALVLLIAGPLFVYFVPDDTTWEVVLQVFVAIVSILGGSAAFAGSNFVSTLQKSD